MSIEAPPLPKTLGPYRIVRQLGQGGMGVVYEAVHEKISRRVAIKLLRKEYAHDSEVGQRFINEARAANLIEHPALVQISEFGQLPDGSTYLVMELLKGENLASRLRRVGTLPLPLVLRIGSQLAEALCAAHEKRIVHRDLKPENVMLVPDSAVAGGERVKLLDFGIAKLAEGGPNRTATSAVIGTPKYMSPEQARGAGRVDEKTDVYALGVMLFELLSGRPPFHGQPGELIAQHLFAPPPPLASLVPSIPPVIAELVAWLLEKDSTKRPTMGEAHRELQEQLSHCREQELAPTNVLPISDQALPPIKDYSTLGSSASQPASTRARTRAPLIAVGVAVAVLGIGGWMVLRGDSGSTQKVATPAKVDAPPTPAAATAGGDQKSPGTDPAAQRPRWSIKTTPSAAQVLRAADQHAVGETPWSFEPPAGSGEQVFIVRLRGYQDQILRFRDSTSSEQSLTLERKGEAKKAGRSKSASKSSAAPSPGPAPLFTPKSWMHK